MGAAGVALSLFSFVAILLCARLFFGNEPPGPPMSL